jgi:hypothetical protein
VPVLLLVWAFRLLGHETPPAIDTAPAYDAARVAHAFDVLTPADLPAGWRVQAAQYRAGVLRIGLVAPGGSGARVMQSVSPGEVVVPAELGSGAHLDGTVTVSGTTWQRYTGGRAGERAVVLAAPGRTVLVAGTATDGELTALAAALR